MCTNQLLPSGYSLPPCSRSTTTAAPFITARSRGSAAKLVPCFEVPARADFVLQELERRQLGAIEAPDAFDDAAIARIHAPRYLNFLSKAWNEWVALDPANAGRDALPSYWPICTFRSDMLPASFPARMGLFSYDAGTPLTAGTWTAARARRLRIDRRSTPAARRPCSLRAHAAAGPSRGRRLLRWLLLPQQRGQQWRNPLDNAALISLFRFFPMYRQTLSMRLTHERLLLATLNQDGWRASLEAMAPCDEAVRTLRPEAVFRSCRNGTRCRQFHPPHSTAEHRDS